MQSSPDLAFEESAIGTEPDPGCQFQALENSHRDDKTKHQELEETANAATKPPFSSF
jgi:hypothetical protein